MSLSPKFENVTLDTVLETLASFETSSVEETEKIDALKLDFVKIKNLTDKSEMNKNFNNKLMDLERNKAKDVFLQHFLSQLELTTAKQSKKTLTPMHDKKDFIGEISSDLNYDNFLKVLTSPDKGWTLKKSNDNSTTLTKNNNEIKVEKHEVGMKVSSTSEQGMRDALKEVIEAFKISGKKLDIAIAPPEAHERLSKILKEECAKAQFINFEIFNSIEDLQNHKSEIKDKLKKHM